MQVLVQPTPVSSESIQDIVASLLQAGTNVTLTYNDVANTLTIAASGGTSYTDEQAQDAIGTILVDTPTIDFTYNDATPAITADVKDASIIEAKLNFSDNTTQNVSTTRHGLVPKAPDNAAQYLDGTGAWSTPAGGEGGIPTDGARIRRIAVQAITQNVLTAISYDTEDLDQSAYFTLGNPTHITVPRTGWYTIAAQVSWFANAGGFRDVNLRINGTDYRAVNRVPGSTASITQLATGVVYLTIADYVEIVVYQTTTGALNVTESIATISYLGTSAINADYWTRTPGSGISETSLIAYWRMEESSGNRVDSKNSIALVPTGTPGNAAGKNGNALAFTTAPTTYLSAPDSAALSIGANQDFSIACWIYFNSTPSGARGIIGKGNASISYNNCEYLLGTSGTNLLWYIRSANVNAGITLAANTWYFVVAWYDAIADIQYIQVNNGTPVQFANSTGSFDSADPVEVGRQPQYTGSAPFDGRIDGLIFWKRVLTASERTALYNGGNGLDYPFPPTYATLSPTTAGDQIVSFLALSDAPDMYAGNALKILRANAAENALEYGPVLGSMATQNANAVAISGGTANLSTLTTSDDITCATDVSANAFIGTAFVANNSGGDNAIGLRSMIAAAGGSNRWNVYSDGNAPSYFGGNVGIGTLPVERLEVSGNARANAFVVNIDHDISAFSTNLNAGGSRNAFIGYGTAPSYFGGTVQVAGNVGLGATPSTSRVFMHYINNNWGLFCIPNSPGSGFPIVFANNAGSGIGNISCTDTTTSYNTSSDVRLKHNIQPLTNVLECIRALRPISHLWNADGSYGEGFLAHELMQQVPLAVTGEPDEVNPDGSIKPQQVDHSKLIPRLTAGLQDALNLIESLTARVAQLEARV